METNVLDPHGLRAALIHAFQHRWQLPTAIEIHSAVLFGVAPDKHDFSSECRHGSRQIARCRGLADAALAVNRDLFN
jgi:hypothetical protein